MYAPPTMKERRKRRSRADRSFTAFDWRVRSVRVHEGFHSRRCMMPIDRFGGLDGLAPCQLAQRQR
jgi:hypothetical protein